MLWIVLGIVLVILIGVGVMAGPIASNVEQAQYRVIESHGAIEIREYAPMIVAEATVSGERSVAINEGFSIIADYIFGNNLPAQKVAMTAPVIQQPAETIAMTAPVTQTGNGGSWTVRFVMPAQYTMDTLPTPGNDAITLTPLTSARFAVIRFSGKANDTMLAERTDELRTFIDEKQLHAISSPTYAFFNPPWTLPFLRRNEVMVEISS